MAKIEKVREKDCIACKAKCCRHVATGIDTPTCKRDYDNIRWYLMHDNVHVFIDNDGDWTIEFFTRCGNLLENNRCAQYHNRPGVCRDYPETDEYCEYENDELPYKALFTTAEEFEKYLEGRKIDWRWKRIK